MTRILVIESNHRTRTGLVEVLPRTAEVVDAADILDAEECLEEEGPFDVYVVQGAMQDGRSPGDIRVTLSFLRHLSQAQPSAKVFVLSNMFDGPEAEQYRAAFPGCEMYRKEAVLNGATILPI